MNYLKPSSDSTMKDNKELNISTCLKDVEGILVKQSLLNETFKDLNAQLTDKADDCIFVRVVRIGEGVSNTAIVPGCLLVIRSDSGIKANFFTSSEGIAHILINESDILAFADF